MKKFLFVPFMLVACATAEKPTGGEMCSNFCSEAKGAKVSLYEDSTCLCQTDNGIKNTAAVCLIKASNQAEAEICLLSALTSCQDDTTKRAPPEPGSFCYDLERAYATQQQL